MKKKTALLIDGGWFSKGLGKILNLPSGWPIADQVIKNAIKTLKPEEEVFRIFYYDCEPFDREVTNPVDGTVIDYKLMPAYAARKKFFFDLGQMEGVALRRGDLKARGWEYRKQFRDALRANGPTPPLTAQDMYPRFEQKGVDMRIGIDVATLSLKKLVDRIILFSGDTDMIPAIKLARREGLQVYVVKMTPWPLKHSLIEDSDGLRILNPTSQ